MIRKVNEQRKFNRSPGVDIQVLSEPEEMYNSSRLYAKLIIAPGASIAFHRHIDEMESFYVVKGRCRVDDNDETGHIGVGDVMVVGANDCHAIYNDGDEVAEVIALIISCKQGVNGSSQVV